MLKPVGAEEWLRCRLPGILIKLSQALNNLAQELVIGKEFLTLGVDEHRSEQRTSKADPFVVGLSDKRLRETTSLTLVRRIAEKRLL